MVDSGRSSASAGLGGGVSRRIARTALAPGLLAGDLAANSSIRFGPKALVDPGTAARANAKRQQHRDSPISTEDAWERASIGTLASSWGESMITSGLRAINDVRAS